MQIPGEWQRYVMVMCFLVIKISNATNIHFKFHHQHQADFVQKLNNYVITIPYKVTAEGDFLSHDVNHHIINISRKKRDTTEKDDQVNYLITLNDTKLHLVVKPNHNLLSPNFVVEKWHNGSFSNITVKTKSSKTCHFVGEIKGHPGSRVALGTCDGIRGFFHSSKHGQYFIEPILGQNSLKREHIIYRHSDIPKRKAAQSYDSCGIKDNDYQKVMKERQAWQNENIKFIPKRRRHKRSVSIERYVEALVVVDPSMVHYYENVAKDNLEYYVLTIMNMVSKLYHDASLGNAINIVLVRLLFLEKVPDNFKISQHGDRTLANFCKWQRSVNPKDDNNPHHHDVAILLTRENICSRNNEPCSTLGMAQVGGMCQSHRSCNINEDTGLALAYTVAHESGHNFAMKHDVQSNGCEATEDNLQHVMSPHLLADTTPIIWSNCSRDTITKFLDREWGYCLNDEPNPPDFKFPEQPPGAIYDADHQCRLQYGPGAAFCEGIEDKCMALWCRVGTKCLTRLEAAAEGTSCGEGMWCKEGACVSIEGSSSIVNGDWGEWSPWSKCSRTCSGGVSSSDRHCDNPMPSRGGKYCLGERKRYRTCNTQKCVEETPSFRHLQCREFNKVLFKGKVHEWDSYVNPHHPCELYCISSDKKTTMKWKDIVTDGTPCRPGKKDFCINGICTPVGCDWKINSGAKEDQCGVCHGDGSQCRRITGSYYNIEGPGYSDVAVIPAGARHIHIYEKGPAKNYIAIHNETGHYYLNGNWVIQWAGEFEAAGTVMQYRRNHKNKEEVRAAGPLLEDFHIQILFQSEENPGIEYSYSWPKPNVTRKLVYEWTTLDWSPCSRTCNGGYQKKDVVCTEKLSGMVDDSYCKKERPPKLMRTCNIHSCPPRWYRGPWQHCNVTCGSGGYQTRTVMCVKNAEHKGGVRLSALEDIACMERRSKPRTIRPCRNTRKCAEWVTEKWQENCHGDPCVVLTRKVTCSNTRQGCDTTKRPLSAKQCGNVNCGVWHLDDWSACSSTCGAGLKTRKVKCVNGKSCLLTSKPIDHVICHTEPCPPTDSPMLQENSTAENTKSTYLNAEFTSDMITTTENTKNKDELTTTRSPQEENQILTTSKETKSTAYENNIVHKNDDVSGIEETSFEKEHSLQTNIIEGDHEASEEKEDSSTYTITTDQKHENDKWKKSKDDVEKAKKDKQGRTFGDNENAIENIFESPETGSGKPIDNKTNTTDDTDSNERDISSVSNKYPSTTQDTAVEVQNTPKEHYGRISFISIDVSSKTKSNGNTTKPPNPATKSGNTTFSPSTLKHIYRESNETNNKSNNTQPENDIKNYIPQMHAHGNDINKYISQVNNEDKHSSNSIFDNTIENKDVNYKKDTTLASTEEERKYHGAENDHKGKNTEKETKPSIFDSESENKKATLEDYEDKDFNKKGRNKKEHDAKQDIKVSLNELDDKTNQQDNKNTFKETANDNIETQTKLNNVINEKENLAPTRVPENDEIKSDIFIKEPENKIIKNTDVENEIFRNSLEESEDKDYRDEKIHSMNKETREKDKEYNILTTRSTIPSTATTTILTTTSPPSTTTKIFTTTFPPPATTTDLDGEHKPKVLKGKDHKTNKDWFVSNVWETIKDAFKGTEDKKKKEKYKWIPHSWSRCSKNCGVGFQKRKITCVESVTGNEVDSEYCKSLVKTEEWGRCNIHDCLQWNTGMWTRCPVKCGQGIQHRQVKCPIMHQCDHFIKPPTSQTCQAVPCASWVTGPWSKCSSTCGGGYRLRHVMCVNKTSYSKEAYCDDYFKPDDTQECNFDPCPQENAALKDWQFMSRCSNNQMTAHVCKLMKRLGHCKQRFVKVKCCRTCGRKHARPHLGKSERK